MLSGKLELNHGSPNNEKNHKPMKQGAQMWVAPDLVKLAVHVPGENEQPSTWHSHMSAPPQGTPPSCTDVINAFPGNTGTWKGAGRRGTAPIKLPQEPGLTERRFVLTSD